MDERPNILIVMSDQHNAGVAGCYGDPLARTPNMDRLAGEGLRFDRCYCPAPVCVPARMAFMTGRRPGENAVTNNPDILCSAMMAWPGRLTEAGYHTALVGRMHFEGPDQFHGFETTIEQLRHWRGNRPVENQYVSDRVPTWSYWSPRESVIDLSGSGRTFVQYRDELVTRHGVAFLESQPGNQDNRPFAAVIGLYNPHPPYVGRRDLFEYYHDRVEVPEDRLAAMPGYLADYYRSFHNWESPRPIPDDAKRRALAAYYANVEHVDEQLGMILDALDRAALSRRTLVIYCSDHGDMLGRKGAWGKNMMYDGAARVPMIARLPGTVPAGRVCNTACNLRNLGNTFCDIAGTDPLEGSDAMSIQALLHGDDAAVDDQTESEIVQPPSAFGQKHWAAFKMLRQGPWKMWCYHIGNNLHHSLFNLEADPAEREDRIDQPELSDVVAAMKRRLHEGWNPAEQIEAARRRLDDRRQTDRFWHKVWLPAGYPVPEDIDADVDTPHARAIASGNKR